MKKLAIIALLFGTATFAQTTTPAAKPAVNPQITDAVTQVQHEKLEARVLALESIIDEFNRKDQISNSRAFFNYDGYVATANSDWIINEVVSFMKDYPAYGVTIEGHADERGTREYNLYLGEKRASSLKDMLVAKGIDAKRIQTVTYGKERPAVLGSNETAWSQNRRGAFILNK